jgi:hypothetical protein
MSKWDLYDYDNEATKYIEMEAEKQKRRQQEYASKLSPLHTGGTFDYERQAEMDKELDFDELDTEVQYQYNRKQFFSNMKEPNFDITETVKTTKPNPAAGSLLHSMGVRPLAKPMKVYKFKTIDQETGAEVIVPQKEIEVVAENDNNYYYFTKKGLQTLAKNETSKNKLDSKVLKQRFMMQINKQSQNLAKNMSSNMQAGDKIKRDVESPRDLSLNFITDKFGGPTPDWGNITVGDAEQKAKGFLFGFGDTLMTPINWVVDQAIKKSGSYTHDENYYKKMSFKLKNGEIPKEMQEAIDKKFNMEKTAKYPPGYSEETDVMEAGGSREQIAEAREKDEEKAFRSFVGKKPGEEITTADNVAKIAGEIVGTLVEFAALGKVSGAVTKGIKGFKYADWIRKGADAIITGGGYGFLEKLKEKDATAIETFKNSMEEAGFFLGGGFAAKGVGKAFGKGPTKTLFKEIAKRGSQAAAFGIGGAAGSIPGMEEEEMTKKNLLGKAAMGTAFELGGGLITKRGRRGFSNKVLKKLGKIGKKKTVIKGTEFESEFGLDKPVKGLSIRKKTEMANEAQKKLVNEIGERINAKVGSSSPKKVVEYYKKKYKLKGKIKVTRDLTGNENIARVEITENTKSGKVIEVKVNPEKEAAEVTGAIRHEIEHIRDDDIGFIRKDVIEPKRGVKTLKEYMQKDEHHKDYENFEIEYLENIYNQELKTGKSFSEIKEGVKNFKNQKSIAALEKQEAALKKQLNVKKIGKKARTKIQGQLKTIEQQKERYRSSMRLFSENKPLRNEVIHATNRELTGASNLPTYVPERTSTKSKVKNIAERMYTTVFNRQEAIDKIGKKVKITSQNYSSYHGTVEHINTKKLVSRHGREIGTKSLKDVIVAPKGYQAEFESYLYHKAHIGRMKRGKPIVADADGKPMKIDEAKKVIAKYEKKFPQFKDASKDVYQFIDDFMQEWAVDGGLITKAEYKQLRKWYPEYIPAFKDLKEFAFLDAPRNVVSNRVIKQAVGGTEPLTPLSESLPVYIQQVVRAQRRNLVHSEILNAAILNPEGMQKYAEVYQPKKMRKEISKILNNFGDGNEVEGTINKINNLLIDTAPTKGRFAVVLAEGQPITMKINDPNVWKVLTKLQKAGTNQSKFLEIMEKGFSKPFKNVVTIYNPFFAVRNIAKDIPAAYIQGSVHNPITFAINFASALKDMSTGAELYKQFKALGGESANITKMERALMQKGNTKKILDKFFSGLNFFGSVSETLPRYSEFKAVYKKGMKKGLPEHQVLQEALYNAKEVTINFNRGGDLTKDVDKVFPYFNAGLQGVDKFYRTLIKDGIAKGNFAPLIKAAGISTSMTALSYFAMKTFAPGVYEDLPDWVLDNYYTFPIGDQIIRIPKTKEYAFIFSTMLQRIQRSLEGDPDAFKNIDWSSSFINPLKELGSGGVFGPTLNISMGGNKDYFNREIEPAKFKFEKTSKRNIVKETTSKASKAFAPILEKIGLSPAQADYLIDSNTGFVGDLILSVNDKEESFGTKLGRMSGLTVSDTARKGTQKKYEDKDKAAVELNDFEYNKGIKAKKEELRERGITRGWRYEDAINNILSFEDREKYEELKEKKKEVNKDE